MAREDEAGAATEEVLASSYSSSSRCHQDTIAIIRNLIISIMSMYTLCLEWYRDNEGEGERERESERERETEKERKKERKKEVEREREIERKKERER